MRPFMCPQTGRMCEHYDTCVLGGRQREVCIVQSRMLRPPAARSGLALPVLPATEREFS